VSGPLAGLIAIEICGPLGQYAGKLLADLGADVIKVEPPEGSEARRVGPFVGDRPGPNRSLNFWYHNTNKRSVVLDLANDAGARESLARLVARADIVLEDNPPGTMAALAANYSSLATDNPGLIYCSITPFGQDGPWANYMSSDLVSLALGGPMNMNGYDAEDAPGAPPIHGKGEQGYQTACHFAVQGILVALYHRDRTGQGQYIDASAHEALSSTTEVGLPQWLYRNVDVVRQTARHAAAARTEPWLFQAKDRDLILFGIGRDNASWAKLKAWLQAGGFGLQLDEERFDSPAARQPGRGSPEAAEVFAEMRKFIAVHDAEEVYRMGQSLDQAWGVVRAPDETLDDPHWHDRGFFVETSGEDCDSALMPGAPYLFSATPWKLRRPAPRLGEHTGEILASLP
jgi:benzylsuccinate CoA-transferase BbsE subunit